MTYIVNPNDYRNVARKLTKRVLLRIVIDESSVLGRWFERSGWFPSKVIEHVTTAGFTPSLDDQKEFGSRVSVMLGFEWSMCGNGFQWSNVINQHFIQALTPDRRWEWLADNTEGLWLITTETYLATDRYYRQHGKIWFENETDATLFALL